MTSMQDPLNVLLIEDNESDADLVTRQLEKASMAGYVLRVESADELKDALQSRSWDIVIADYSLPQFNAPAALKIVRETDSDIPFIVVSGTVGEETAVLIMKSGAQDYLMKGNLTRLVPAISRELAEARNRRNHRLALIALRESEAKFRAVFENSVDAIGVSLSGTMVFTNPSFISLFGFNDHSELQGRLVTDLIAPSEKARVSAYIKNRGIDQNVPNSYATRGLKSDGTEFDMDVRVSIFEIENTKYTLVILRDITQRIQEQQELVRARKAAEDADRFKSALMMNLSHEIRTPMNSILGFSGLISNEADNDDVREMATRINNSGIRLMKTLDDILELSQLQSGVEKFNLVHADLRSELEKLIHHYRPKAEARNLTLRFNDDLKVNLSLPGDLFNKALGEIILNAVKFTDNGGIKVSLSKVMEGTTELAEVRVTDTGIGIAREHQQIIFESFRQVSSGFGRKYEGSGLGLTLAKKIVDLLDGKISVESELGKGSAFILRFPLAGRDETRLSDLRQQVPAIEISKSADLPDRAEKPLILLVEDNEDNIHMATQFCKNDYNITSAICGETAIELARMNQYDLILMDINLGTGMDGLTAANMIRSFENYRNIPIVAMTGYTLQSDKMRILSGGCDYYLSKPFTRHEILDCIGNVLRKR
jgi:PAS domain S-box-containing protein